MDIYIIIIIVSLVVITGVTIFINYQSDIKENDINIRDLSRKYCRYIQNGEAKIRDECIEECEEKGSAYTVYENVYVPRVVGSKTVRQPYLDQDGITWLSRNVVVDDIVQELQETATTYTFPPECNKFCANCSYLE
tara:strand:- start:204 stop:611 length:408 start_codon:yes stop_codon:yes gene_type:complete